jgi:hypothetical protein
MAPPSEPTENHGAMKYVDSNIKTPAREGAPAAQETLGFLEEVHIPDSASLPTG